jgi:hypothetical protein
MRRHAGAAAASGTRQRANARKSYNRDVNEREDSQCGYSLVHYTLCFGKDGVCL